MPALGSSRRRIRWTLLGISVSDLQGISPEQQFQLFANALADVDDASTRAALAQDVFGRAGTELLPLFTQGEQGMAGLTGAGGAVGRGDVRRCRHRCRRLSQTLRTSSSRRSRACSSTLGPRFVPALTKFIRKVIEWKPQIIAFFTRIKEASTPFFEAFKTGTEVVFPILQKFFKFIFDNKPLLIAAIAAVGIAIVVALGPGAIAVAAIVGIITIIGLIKKNWEKIWAAVANFFIGVVNKIIDGINKVTGILSKLPGVADIELQKFENVVVDAAQTTDTLTVAAEEVTPAVKAVGAGRTDRHPASGCPHGLVAATDNLSVL